MFTDKIELKDFEKQDPEYQDLLRRVLAIQADCEIGGPNLYVKDILPSAPTKLDQGHQRAEMESHVDREPLLGRHGGENPVLEHRQVAVARHRQELGQPLDHAEKACLPDRQRPARHRFTPHPLPERAIPTTFPSRRGG